MKLYVQALSALLWFLWPLSTLAASVTIGDTIGDIPLRAWVTVVVLSVISGVMALLQRMGQALVLEQQLAHAEGPLKALIEQQLALVELPPGWRLFVTWHIAGSLLMGVLSFLFLEASPMNDFIEAVCIALSSYSGARLFDKLSKVFTDRVIESFRSKGSSQ